MSDQLTTTPTTVRLDGPQLKALNRIRDITRLAKGTIISLAVSALIDHVERTGKLPVSRARKSNQDQDSQIPS